MTPGQPPRPADWRGPAAPAAPPPAAGPAWRTPPAAAPYRTRWLKVGGVAALLVAVLAAVSYAALWLRPPAPAYLVVVEAGYETNLAVPPNGTGKAAGRDLAAMAKPGSGSLLSRGGRLRGPAEPVRLTRGAVTDFLPDLDAMKEKTVVVVLALHGGRDRDGAFLFPDDATPDPAQRLRLPAVLDRLKKLPAEKHKLLVLDATQPAAYPDLGILHNDFADALDRLEPDIAAIPNLVVVSSSGTDERSWASPEWGRSAFGHYLALGMAGPADADRDRRLTAWELFEYVRPRVHDWARDHRAALQTPVLLPRGPEGEKRARAIHVDTVDPKTEVPTPTPTPFDPPPELERAWDEYRTLAASTPSPLTATPHLWREYEAWVLRYEHLLLADTPEAAGEVRAKAADTKRRIEAARRLDVSPQSLALPFAVGGVPGSRDIPPAITDGIARLASAPAADRAKLWAEARGSVPDRDPEAVRLLWCSALVKWVAVDPASRLAAGSTLVPLVAEWSTVRPSELHLLAMFAAHAPRFSKADPAGPLLGSLLNLRTQAEAVAVGLPPDGEAYAGYVLPWVRATLRKADEERRAAEDLAFASDEAHWTESARHGGRARIWYQMAEQEARLVRGAVGSYHHGAARLPTLADWLTYFPASEGPVARHTREEASLAARETWRVIHASGSFINSTPGVGVNSLGGVQDMSLVLGTYFHDLDNRLSKATDTQIATRPEFDARRETRADLVHWWDAADALLAVPPATGTPPAKRVRLGVEARRVSRQLLVTGVTQPEALPEVSAAATREQAFQTARWRGLLELSRVGADAFPEPQGFTQAEFRLNNFALQADGRATLADVGAMLGKVLGTIPPAGADADLNTLRLADRRVRLAPAGVTVALKTSPADLLRRRDAEAVLLAQAERTDADHWYGGPTPYYRVAVDHLLADAKRVRGRDLGPVGAAWATRQAAADPFPLRPVTADKQWLTDQPDLTVAFPIERDAKGTPRPGFAVFWADDPFPAAPLPGEKPPAPPAREVRDTAAGTPAAVVQTVRPPAGARPTVPTAVAAASKLMGFFRGRLIAADSPVTYYPVADRVASRVPPPPAATLAVRADPLLQAKYGTATGSVAFVLDCSGSMGPPPGGNGAPGHYPAAVDVLAKLLRQLPAGTNVSVWSFGQRGGDSALPEDSITEQLPPTRWERNNAAAADNLEGTLRGLGPWNESSVMRALLRARDGLRDAPGPFKAVVLISDCVDNRFAEDAALNPRKQAIKDALRTEFGGGDVRLGVVAFKVTDKTEVASQAQFEAVTKFSPAGVFVPPERAADVLGWLRSGLNPRIRYRVVPVATRGNAPASIDLSAGDDSADNWYPGRLPPGTYELRVLADREYRRELALEAGDRLLMQLREDRGALTTDRVWYAAEAPALARSRADDDANGRLSLLQNQSLDKNAVRMLAAVEGRPTDVPLLTADRVGDVWFALTPTVPKPPPLALRYAAEPGYPAPAWTLDVAGWPALPGGKALATPTLEAWWHPAGPFPAAASWSLPGGHPLTLPPTPVAVGDDAVTVDAIRLEDQPVAVAAGRIEVKKCLVVRLTHPAGTPFWARPLGLSPGGSEARFYTGANKSTSVFWWADAPPSAATIEGQLTGLELVSAADALRKAADAGHYLKIDQAPAPAAGAARPQPPAAGR